MDSSRTWARVRSWASCSQSGRGLDDRAGRQGRRPADFLYETTDYYAPEHERCLAYDDPTVAIDRPSVGLEFRSGAKDQEGLTLAAAAGAG